MFIKKMNLPRLFIVILLICSGSFIYADDNKSSINAIWQDIKTNSRDLVEKSIKIFYLERI
jgi:hypothetical protein